MVKLKIVSSNDFLSPANVAIKAEGELLRQKAKIALMDSVSDLTRRTIPYFKDRLNNLHTLINDFIDKCGKFQFLQECIKQLKSLRADLKRKLQLLT